MRDLSRAGAKINSGVGKAIADYDLIKDGDRILVAVSGGKDSLTLLKLLKQIQKWAPVKYELFAAHIKTDFHCGSCVHDTVLTGIFRDMGIEHVFRDIKVLDEKGRTTCFWCAWNKRKALFEIAGELKCGKVAFGHHKDDIVETMLMNLLYNGEISAMNPRQEMFKGEIVIIRPLCYVEEKLIRKFAAESGFPEKSRECPFGKESRRKYIKDFIRETERQTPDLNIKTNIFKSLSRIKQDYIDARTEKEEDPHA
ncbi:MAG: ATP-binding protein [Candidatus Omnitrophota bacterium]